MAFVPSVVQRTVPFVVNNVWSEGKYLIIGLLTFRSTARVRKAVYRSYLLANMSYNVLEACTRCKN